jgi:hypothetical protein
LGGFLPSHFNQQQSWWHQRKRWFYPHHGWVLQPNMCILRSIENLQQSHWEYSKNYTSTSTSPLNLFVGLPVWCLTTLLDQGGSAILTIYHPPWLISSLDHRGHQGDFRGAGFPGSCLCKFECFRVEERIQGKPWDWPRNTNMYY